MHSGDLLQKKSAFCSWVPAPGFLGSSTPNWTCLPSRLRRFPTCWQAQWKEQGFGGKERVVQPSPRGRKAA